jgi:selenide,water dikinase
MTFDPKRRRAVMSRSIRLQHCVCDAKKPCPCDIFKQHNVCQCAGEKLPLRPAADVRLTRHVRKAGCASKIGQADLLRILSRLPPVNDPNIMVGLAAGDDAGIYRIDDKTALVQTVDVFTPCVDDPELFGRIAAANSVSDVYAMGGRPLTALSIVAFPIDDLDGAVMEAMLKGAMRTLDEAGCALVGGHSIQDSEIKMGFAVTGLIAPDAVIRRAAAKPGDVLVLTKPLGTGMIAFAAQIGRASEAVLREAGESMATLNRAAAEAMQRHGANAATDITGFGLAGHLVEMARGSGVSMEIGLGQLPVFRAVPACLEQQILSGAVERNQDYAMGWIVADAPEAPAQAVLYDPQTSGGLLVSLPPERADAYVADLRGRGNAAVSVVGRVLEACPSPRVFVRGDRVANLHGLQDLT